MWHATGRSSRDRFRVLTFFVDAANGELIHTRSEVSYAEVTGTVTGLMTPGGLPDSDANPTVSAPLAGLEVTSGTETVHTDADGAYSIDLPEIPLDVETELVGEWVRVQVSVEPPELLSAMLIPPATVNFAFNEADDEYKTAQVNAYVHTHETHEFYAERAPDFEDIDIQIDANTNIGFACVGGFIADPPSINMSRAGTVSPIECPNFSYRSVVVHEYGHFVAEQLGVNEPGGFREGYCDSLAILRSDDPIIGPDALGVGTVIRDTVATNQQAPCSTPEHDCGMVLSGIWWSLREGLGDALGDAEGLELAQQWFVDWTLITLGTPGGQAATYGTVIELLTIDDDDGDLTNGTPNEAALCGALVAHGLECDARIRFLFPEGLPHLVSIEEVTSFPMVLDGVDLTPVDDTGVVHVSINAAPFEETTLVSTADVEYTVDLGPFECGDVVEFYFTVETTDGGTFSWPPGAPEGTSLVAGAGLVESVVLYDDFEVDQGWVVGDDVVPDDATTGVWERGEPLGTQAQPELDRSDTGTLCYFTGQGTLASFVGENDVDDGKTTLVTPPLELRSSGMHLFSYWVWFSNDIGQEPNTDVFRVEITEDDGASWIAVPGIEGDSPAGDGDWVLRWFDVEEYVTLGSTVRVRFIAEDSDPQSIVEAAIDDVRLTRYLCAEPSGDFLRGDCNSSETISLLDALYLLEYLFGFGPPPECADACDVDDDGALDIGDVIRTLVALFLDGDIPAPFPECGMDESDDALECPVFTGCP